MSGIGERCNNVWPQSASRDLPPKKLRGMQGMQHEEEKKKRKEERRGEEERRGGGEPTPLLPLAAFEHPSCTKLQSEFFFFFFLAIPYPALSYQANKQEVAFKKKEEKTPPSVVPCTSGTL